MKNVCEILNVNNVFLFFVFPIQSYTEDTQPKIRLLVAFIHKISLLTFNDPFLLSHPLHIVKNSNRKKASDAIVPILLTQLLAYLFGETGAPGVGTHWNQLHRPLLHRCCRVVVLNSPMIWLAGRARQRHGAIITDGEAACGKTNSKSTQKSTSSRAVPIHLNRGNILRVVLTSFNHGGNWCIFFFCSYKQARGKALLSACFFFSPSPHSCLFLSPPATCCSGRQSTAQARGRERQEGKWKRKKKESKRWEAIRKEKGTGRNSDRQTQGQRDHWRQLGNWESKWRRGGWGGGGGVSK